MPALVNSPIIGYHRSPLTQKFGIPRQPNLVPVPSYIEMSAPYHTADAFEGIEAFSHLWITWQTHQNRTHKTFKPKVRPPRLGGNTKLGVFATRSTYRPSQLGLSVVRLIGIELTHSGVIVNITGADMVDATPIIDIKPYIAYSDAIVEAESGFAPHAPMQKTVKISTAASKQFANLASKNVATNALYSPYLVVEDLEIICCLIAQDPRPAYRQDDTEHVFMMRYKQVDIGFRMHTDGILWIESVNVF